jgi:NAD(P)-dependent dehydrogenase (short-subunit alcohol dehydrogenase family)
MKDFAGRVGVVTGSARGIGFALARALLQRGMHMVVSDVGAARPARAAEVLAAQVEGTDVVGVVCDVTDVSDVQALAHRALERHGRIDLLCNNAGIVAGGPTWSIPLATWRQVLDVNLLGAIHTTHVFVPHLMENPAGGHVVNVASLAAVTPVRGIAPYNVAKHGLLALSETLSADLEAAGSRVGVTVVMPGRVATALGRPSGEADPDASGAEPGVLSPGAVSELIVRAVEDDQLYLFTHPERMGDVKARFAAITGQPR